MFFFRSKNNDNTEILQIVRGLQVKIVDTESKLRELEAKFDYLLLEQKRQRHKKLDKIEDTEQEKDINNSMFLPDNNGLIFKHR